VRLVGAQARVQPVLRAQQDRPAQAQAQAQAPVPVPAQAPGRADRAVRQAWGFPMRCRAR
jgi:hypothetical protein